MLQNYKIFENLQQAEKFVKSSIERYNKLDNDNRLYNKESQKYKLENYEKLKTYLKSKKSLGYLYLLTKILFSNGGHENHLIKIKEYFELNLNYGIKINLDKYSNFDKLPYGNAQFYVDILDEISLIQTNKFIDKWAPGFLKKELKSKYKIKLRDVFFEMLKYDPLFYKNKNPFNKIDTTLLRGKMSMFKSAQDWFKYIINVKDNSNNRKIKKSNNLKIYYEDDEWIIYQPLTYESMNIIIYPKWCTIVKNQYEGRKREGYTWIVLYNKKSIKNSYIAEFNTYYSDGNDSKNCFTIHDYDDIIISKLICNLDNNTSIIAKNEIFKVFLNLDIVKELI